MKKLIIIVLGFVHFSHCLAQEYHVSNSPKYYSFFRERLPGKSTMVELKRDSVTGVRNKIILTNASPLLFIAKAFSEEIGPNQFNRIILEVKDSSGIKQPVKGQVSDEEREIWKNKNIFCYESKILQAEDSSRDQAILLKKYMQQDLERHFRLKGFIEKRMVKCLALSNYNNANDYKSNDTTTESSLTQGKNGLEIINGKITHLLYFLQQFNGQLNYPIVDNTNYSGRISLKIKPEPNFTNIQSLRSELQKFGLDLIVKELEIDMLIIRDITN